MKNKKNQEFKSTLILILVLGLMPILLYSYTILFPEASGNKLATQASGEMSERELELSDKVMINYLDFLTMVEEQEVKQVYIKDKNQLYFMDRYGYEHTTNNPNKEGFVEELLLKGIPVEYLQESNEPISSGFGLNWWLIVLAILLFGPYIINKVRGAIDGTKLGSPISSKSSKFQPETDIQVRFSDVAGIDEVKESFNIMLDTLKSPAKYRNLGAKPSKGFILAGPSGVGKTLIAKAVAGEANVPFFAITGSQFTEKYVGVGAARVRELFATAKAYSPCIIFIDEVDAIARRRSGDDSGANVERDSTLNQLLTEMSGFNEDNNIIVIAATNRLNLLDEAFTRPGRFDRTIQLSLPTKQARLDILKVHAKNLKLDEDVNLDTLAEETRGLSGAALATILNEAATLSGYHRKKSVTKENIDKAYLNYILKGETKKTQEKRDEDIRMTAYHEAGHALVSKLLTPYRRITKVTTLSTTSGAGGFTLRMLDETTCLKKEDILNEIKVAFAGRVGELLYYKDANKVSTGASEDINQATDHLWAYITQYGMTDEIGMLNTSRFLHNSGTSLIAPEQQGLEIAKKLAKQFYEETKELLENNLELLETIAQALVDKETLNEDELNELVEI